MAEETGEFNAEPSIEEAADIYEVFLAMIEHQDVSLADVIQKAISKRKARGGFRKKILLKTIGEKV